MGGAQSDLAKMLMFGLMYWLNRIWLRLMNYVHIFACSRVLKLNDGSSWRNNTIVLPEIGSQNSLTIVFQLVILVI